MIATEITERVAQVAFLADRRPQALPVALDGVGDLVRRLIGLPGEAARPLRDKGQELASLLGVARVAHERLNVPARNAAIAEMGRVAARVAALELLIPLLPPEATRVRPAVPVSFPPSQPRVPRGGAAPNALRTFLRLVRREGQPERGVRLTLIQGGRA